ncbi:MAG: type 1 glutamine amidotransferase [Pirellulaceae bacterium]|nr:type 1 glutamine amidotransferase [Pirellulaceae bacterium]
MWHKVRYLLLQVRNPHDPMRAHEVGCFARALHCSTDRIAVFDLLGGVPSRHTLDGADVVLLGGAGEYSVAAGGEWLERALEAMRELNDFAQPTFASCWGFQAMARALGGEVLNDRSRSEVGTHLVTLTAAGQVDPLFSTLPPVFWAQMGHEDHVVRLPDAAIHLAATERSANQAFCLPGKPIYCTQFHPEIRREDLLTRLRAYPHYAEEISGQALDQFERSCRDTPEAESLLPRFVQHVLS